MPLTADQEKEKLKLELEMLELEEEELALSKKSEKDLFTTEGAGFLGASKKESQGDPELEKDVGKVVAGAALTAVAPIASAGVAAGAGITALKAKKAKKLYDKLPDAAKLVIEETLIDKIVGLPGVGALPRVIKMLMRRGIRPDKVLRNKETVQKALKTYGPKKKAEKGFKVKKGGKEARLAKEKKAQEALDKERIKTEETTLMGRLK